MQRWTHLARPGGTVLDIACGQGRHMQWFTSHGFSTTGIDRSAEALTSARQYGTSIEADIENGHWPLMDGLLPQQFDVVIVINYLWRMLMPTLIQCLAPGGLLLYETFAIGNACVGKPSRPDFLLQPGELLKVCQSLHIVAYEDGFLNQPERFVQRIAAIRQTHDIDKFRSPDRHPLSLK